MNFRTEIKPLDCQGNINHDSRILLIGSCFSDEIGARLVDANFDVLVNPMGTLYNPCSITDQLSFALSPAIAETGLLKTSNGWCSFYRHSRFSDPTPEGMAHKVEQSWAQCGEYLRCATHLIITFGSAIGFIHKKSGMVVANCHKVAASEFERVHFSIDNITACCNVLLKEVYAVNPNIHIILTVSPVRHSGYGLSEDRLSKSRLIVASHALAESHPNVSYFPSYEALVDDLRDYRFYADDLAHPSLMAVDYIYNVFENSYFDTPTQLQAHAWSKLSRLLKHRAGNPAEAERLRAQAFAQAKTLAARQPGGAHILERFCLRYSNGTETY